MSTRHRWFEALHKTIGYFVLVLGMVTIICGLVHANGPNWMWIVLVLWWLGLAASCFFFERRGMAVPSYQVIWGDDPAHPGNTATMPADRAERMKRVQNN